MRPCHHSYDYRPTALALALAAAFPIAVGDLADQQLLDPVEGVGFDDAKLVIEVKAETLELIVDDLLGAAVAHNAFAREQLVELINEHFDLRPGAIIRDLELRRPIYRATAAYGHFGRDDIEAPWENTQRADLLRQAAARFEPVTA